MTSKPLFIYAAMFDEVDEGTAMFKAASALDDTPSEGQFLYYSVDGVRVAEDLYLELAGNFTRSWRARRANEPSPPAVQPGYASGPPEGLSRGRGEDAELTMMKAHAQSFCEKRLQAKLALRQLRGQS